MLNLASFFHLNLMYSSIREEDRAEVVRRCYHPLLDLATPECPVSLEATGLTLEMINEIDPQWLAKLQGKLASGAVEFVGSGYCQIIGPLVPGRVNQANLQQGLAVYEARLGLRPQLWLVNEMAYSGGLPELYAAVGASALVMEWNNAWQRHPDWDPELRYHHQLAQGCEGTSLPVLWIDTIDFQRFQRMASDHLDRQEWVDHWADRAQESVGKTRFAALYGSDAEVFDFRPGRYNHEGTPGPLDEWQRVGEALTRLADEPELKLTTLGAALSENASPFCGRPLRLECTAQPVVVKKQQKYNLNRWAVSGRGDLEANTACFAAAAELDAGATDQQWRDLLRHWASDFRTHITEQRWLDFQSGLPKSAAQFSLHDAVAGENVAFAPESRYLDLATDTLRVSLDLKRGLALRSAIFPRLGDEPALGTLPLGHFDDIAFGADFFTGHAVVQYPGQHKLTDLQACASTTTVTRRPDGSLVAASTIVDGDLKVCKQVELVANRPELVLSGHLELPTRRPGEVHPVHLTIVPGLLDPASLQFCTHNGGLSQEVFSLAEGGVHHGASYSTLVTAKGGLGATEGSVVIGDDRRRLVVRHDPCLSALIPTVRFEKVRGGGYFLRLRYSAQEIDETFVGHDQPWHVEWKITIEAQEQPHERR